MSQQIMHDAAIEATKAAPPLAVTGAMVVGVTPADLVAIVTLIYLGLQIGLLFFKYRDEFRRWREERKVKRNPAACDVAEGGD